MEKVKFENRLRLMLSEYLLSTNTRTMTPVRKQILQILIFLYGEENRKGSGEFSYSDNREVVDQQKKYILFAYLFLEALRKNTITETDLTTLQRMWDQHLLCLTNRDMEKTAEKYIRILHSSKDTIINIKRFQRHLMKNSADVKLDTLPIPFTFRKSTIKERLTMRLRNTFGHGDPKDFLMLKFYNVQKTSTVNLCQHHLSVVFLFNNSIVISRRSNYCCHAAIDFKTFILCGVSDILLVCLVTIIVAFQSLFCNVLVTNFVML